MILIALATSKFAQSSESRRLTVKQIISSVSHSLVAVETLNAQGEILSSGSGFFLRNSNKVVTNLHVLKRGSQARVRILNDRVSYNVTNVIGFDRKHDLCILEVNGANVPGLNLAETNVEVGDDIYAAGNPKGLEGTFSKGIVSASEKLRD